LKGSTIQQPDIEEEAMDILENCPVCDKALINGRDGKQQIKYPPEQKQKFDAGEINLEELNQSAQIVYTRERLCNTASIPENDDKPCPNYHGGDMSNPQHIVQVIEIPDN
jgi:hypothetical protein